MPDTKQEVGILTGRITKDGVELEGTWKTAVYFYPNQSPVQPLAYFIGVATRTEDPK